MEEITRLANLPVYTRDGTRVGTVKNVLLNLQERRVEGLLLGKTNPDLVEDGRDVCIPYRWVQSFSDILLLRFFPEHVTVTDASAEGAPEAAPAPAGPHDFEEVAEPAPAPAASATRSARRASRA